jgi:flagellar biosynthesis/type III secretory pathway protein FliH
VSGVTHGRVVRGDGTTGVPETPRLDAGHAGRRIAREELDARTRAAAILADAAASAKSVLADAVERATREARDAEQAKVAAMYLTLRAAEEQRAERDLDRAVELAALLAERMLGIALDKEPATIALIARQALAEARGARRARIEAHPSDAGVLEGHIASLGLPPAAVEIVTNDALSRGSLVLHTDLGTLDARLAPQLERLAAALRDALRSPS